MLLYCPYCQAEDNKVLETRKDAGHIQRRRQCQSCGNRFATVERVNVDYLTVRKRGGQIERFQREKIIKGIGKAASVFKIPAADVNAFIDRILDHLQPDNVGAPIPTKDIGELVLRFLQDTTSVTDVARIRFAMVFKGKTSRAGGFEDAGEFSMWLLESYPKLESFDASGGPQVVLKRPPRDVETFDLTKVERSVGIAAKGRGSDAKVKRLATEVAARALAELTGQPIVTSHQIATFVLQSLRPIDDIAYLRYAAATKPFRSVEDFWRETMALIQRRD